MNNANNVCVQRFRNYNELSSTMFAAVSRILPPTLATPLPGLSDERKPVRNAGKHPTILVVDDDFEVREALRDVLLDDGYLVSIAIHGLDALTQLAGGLVPDLIILDLEMPVLDGYRFLQRRAADSVLVCIPVIVVSASINERLSLLEILSFRKPIDLSRLLREIERKVIEGSGSDGTG
jgi:CheY-like chemotaxis protein